MPADAAHTLCVLMGERTVHGALTTAEERVALHRLAPERTRHLPRSVCARTRASGTYALLRYEHKAEHFLAFAGIVTALICHRRLVRVDGQEQSA
ncbi:DUF5133 domain-containing protein [Streptomyces sp. NPDC051555]|uniref:DUF5133 domain-containing protein n=1 Tax=Streptomyces sp. NPDC051555 TaxID=3365657 RepID=UPI00379DFC0D